MAEARHFVIIHKVALIQGVNEVDSILDDLHDRNLLTREQCNKVRSKGTTQDQMRELYRYVESWGNEDKDQLLQSLRRHEYPIIKCLEGLQ